MASPNKAVGASRRGERQRRKDPNDDTVSALFSENLWYAAKLFCTDVSPIFACFFRRSNPITPQSPVVVNGWFDRHFCTWRQRNAASRHSAGSPFDDVSVENYNILPRELAFKLIPEFDKYIQRPASSAGHDHGPRIFTSVNGFPFFDSPIVKDPRALRDYVVFVGVPLISIDAGNANQKDGVSISVAGSTTITNTGPLRINTGQLVMWDIPKALPSISQELTKVNSVPRNKVRRKLLAR